MPPALPIVIVVTVSVTHSIAPPAIVTRALAETSAIWRTAGVAVYDDTTDVVPDARLIVEFGDAVRPTGDDDVSLAWIDLDGGEPTTHIHVSVASAMRVARETPFLHDNFRFVPGAVDDVVGRGLGRALAHEIGHFLYRSRQHDPDGVMATHRRATEMFGVDRNPFLPTAAERRRLQEVLDLQGVAPSASAARIYSRLPRSRDDQWRTHASGASGGSCRPAR